MAAIGIIGSLISGVFGAIGAMQQASAAAAAAQQNAAIADYNRKVSERNAAATLQTTQLESDEKRREGQRRLSSMRVAYGASNLSLEGSPLDVLEDTALEQELDVAKLGYKGRVKAVGYKDEAANYAMKAELHRMEAESAQAAGPISAIGKLFGGFSSAGSSLMRMG